MGQIARVKAGRFEAWFDSVGDHFEVEWYDSSIPRPKSFRAFRFESLESAKEFWHKEVIGAKNIQHCYCC